METTQDSFQFPSGQIQEVVNKLWDKIHEVSGTLNFLIERNTELKRKLDAKYQPEFADSASSAEYIKRIEGLELEISEYLQHIYELETKIKEYEKAPGTDSTLESNYSSVIEAYNRLKQESKIYGKPALENLQAEKQKQIDENNEIIDYLREEVAQKNKQMTKTTEELLRVSGELNLLKESNSTQQNAASEIEKLNQTINEINNSREQLKEEAEILRIDLLRKEQQRDEGTKSINEENESLKQKLTELNDEYSEKEEKLKSELTSLQNQVNSLNEQLGNADSLLSTLSKKEEFIEELALKLENEEGEKNIIRIKLEEVQHELDTQKSDYEFAKHRISELNSEIARLESEAKLHEHDLSPAVEADLEIKEKMLKEFAAKEKELVFQIQQFETELEEKNKLISNNKEADLILEKRLETLENLLNEKESVLKEQTKQMLITGNKMNASESKVADLTAKLNSRESELKELSSEHKHIKRESDSKSTSIRTLETQLENCREKIREFEISLIKTDSKISIDEAIRADLITNLEKQLAKIELLIGK